MRRWMLATLVLASAQTYSDGFRCGARLVLTGDTVSRLLRACGQPDATMKARAEVRNRGNKRQASVTQWIYQRGRKKDIIVFIHDGRVLQIDRG